MDLEKIIYNEDSGTDAIQKLDRNQRKIGNKVETLNTDGLQQQINELLESDKGLLKQINALSDERGYLTTKDLHDGYDLNLLIRNGLYYIYAPKNTPVPSNGNNNGYCEVITANAEGYLTQVFTQTVTGVKWVRVCSGNIWQPWQQIATTTRTVITSYFNGWSAWANAYHLKLDKIGGRVICSGILVIGARDNGTLICYIPEGFRPTTGLEPRFLNGNNGENLQVTIHTSGEVFVDISAPSPWSTSNSILLDFSCSWEV